MDFTDDKTDYPFQYRGALVVNLKTIKTNISNIKKKLSKSTKLMAIVKADGYGHGALAISKKAEEMKVDWLGVAMCDEGITLREKNINLPILILGYTPANYMENAVRNNLTLTISDYDNAIELSKICEQNGLQGNIHIKIDSGMGRIGFLPKIENVVTIKNILKLPCVNVTGIYTHLAQSDCIDKSYAYYQLNTFKEFLKELEHNGIIFPLVHISNSGAILDLRDFDCDMVRAGIALYGLSPSEFVNFNDFELKPAISFESYVSFVKELDINQSIGYNRTYFTDKKTVVAIIPIGYADGYSRQLSNRGKVIINGEYANIIGNICMDQFMVDATHIKNIKAGDKVVLIGEQKDKSITVDDLAKIQNTINYEVVCGISKRVKRVYI